MALFGRKEPISASDLRYITRGLQQAAAATHNLIAQQYIELFDQFFDHDYEKLGAPMKAKMVEVALDEQHKLSVPLIALVAPRGLALERMQVDLSVTMHGSEVEQAGHELENSDVQSQRFMVTFSKDKRQNQQRDPDEVQISMEFKACEPPEAILRLIEEYTNLISPVREIPEPAPDTPDTTPSTSE